MRGHATVCAGMLRCAQAYYGVRGYTRVRACVVLRGSVGLHKLDYVGICLTRLNSWFLVTFETTFCSNYI